MGEVITLPQALQPPDGAWRLKCGLTAEGQPVIIVSAGDFQRQMVVSRTDGMRFAAMLMSVSMHGVDEEEAKVLERAGEDTLTLMNSRQLVS
jgi:hypothetical protein